MPKNFNRERNNQVEAWGRPFALLAFRDCMPGWNAVWATERRLQHRGIDWLLDKRNLLMTAQQKTPVKDYPNVPWETVENMAADGSDSGVLGGSYREIADLLVMVNFIGFVEGEPPKRARVRIYQYMSMKAKFPQEVDLAALGYRTMPSYNTDKRFFSTGYLIPNADVAEFLLFERVYESGEIERRR